MSRLFAPISFLLLSASLIAAGAASPARAKPDAARVLLALSEIQQQELPASEIDEPPPDSTPAPTESVPFPDPVLRLPLPDAPGVPGAAPEPGEPDLIEDVAPEVPGPEPEPGPDISDPIDDATPEPPTPMPAQPAPEVLYDLEQLPEEVRRMRALLMDAARSGDLERLRPLIGTGDGATQLSFGGPVDDPIAYLRDISGDDEGQEILAILLEVLEAGYVHLEPGTPNEIYGWPYFFAVPVETLTPRQRVELFEIVTAGDYEEMKLYGAYNFYRVGIAPDGRWLFFVAGD